VDTGVIQRRLDELAVDIGRLRRRLNGDKTVWTDLDVWTLEKIGLHVLEIAGLNWPNAAEIVARHAPGDVDAIDEALRIVDDRDLAFRRKLGLGPGPHA
jgi:hypothetical protein